MATRIATIAAHVTAQDRGFSATMNRVREEAKKTKAVLDGAGGESGGGSGGTTGSGGVAGIGQLIQLLGKGIKGAGPIGIALGVISAGALEAASALNKIVEARDRIETRSDTAGVLGLSYSEMQAFNVAATYANTTLENIDGSIARFVNVLTSAADGSDEARAALQNLGVTVDDFKGKSTFEGIQLIADALRDMQSVGERNSAAMNLFGKEMGLKMVTALEGGSDALRRHKQAAEDMGLSLSDLEIRTVKYYNTLKDQQQLRAQARQDQEAALNELANEMDVARGEAYGLWTGMRKQIGGTIAALSGFLTRLHKVGYNFDLLDQYNAGLLQTRSLMEQTAIILNQKGGKEGFIDQALIDADKKKFDEHRRLMEQWKEEHDQWLQDFYNSSFDNFASQPGLGGGNTPVWMGMTLNDMKQAYQMQQKMAEWDKAIQDGNERDLIAADQARREKEKELAKMAADSAGRFAPLLVSGSAEAQRAAYIASMQSNGVAIDPAASSQAARDKESLRIQRDNARVLKQIEQNTKPRASGSVGV